MNGLDKAIKHQGGLTALGAALGLGDDGKGIVYQWKVRGRVPPKYCPSIEKLTGVRCEELNNDVDWTFLRSTELKSITAIPEPV